MPSTSETITRRMNNPPVFSKLDADRILRRAAEIEGSEDSRRFTADDLRSIAGEAGFGIQAVERAIAEAQQAAASDVRRRAVHRSGIVKSYISTSRTIPIEITSDELMNVVRLCQPYREGPAQLKLERDRITWRDRKGLSFTVTSAGGETEIQVVVSKFAVRRGRWMTWVRAAADRLESLVLLVAAQGQHTIVPPPEPMPSLAPGQH